MSKREIKFRAWDIDSKSWVDSTHAMIQIGTGRLLYPFNGENESWFPIGTQLLSQYTGLKDKNGKEIYEGDILQDIEGLLGVVKYSGSKFSAFDSLGWNNLQFPEESIVVGNIYENPELIEP
jgi:uncharacterized phage protein (TIGR01671 family)